jgi:hypothetical protein
MPDSPSATTWTDRRPADERIAMSTEEPVSSAAPEDEPIGDASDQAQRLRNTDEQEAISRALGEPEQDAEDILQGEYLARLKADDD